MDTASKIQWEKSVKEFCSTASFKPYYSELMKLGGISKNSEIVQNFESKHKWQEFVKDTNDIIADNLQLAKKLFLSQLRINEEDNSNMNVISNQPSINFTAVDTIVEEKQQNMIQTQSQLERNSLEREIVDNNDISLNPFFANDISLNSLPVNQLAIMSIGDQEEENEVNENTAGMDITEKSDEIQESEDEKAEIEAETIGNDNKITQEEHISDNNHNIKEINSNMHVICYPPAIINFSSAEMEMEKHQYMIQSQLEYNSLESTTVDADEILSNSLPVNQLALMSIGDQRDENEMNVNTAGMDITENSDEIQENEKEKAEIEAEIDQNMKEKDMIDKERYQYLAIKDKNELMPELEYGSPLKEKNKPELKQKKVKYICNIIDLLSEDSDIEIIDNENNLKRKYLAKGRSLFNRQSKHSNKNAINFISNIYKSKSGRRTNSFIPKYNNYRRWSKSEERAFFDRKRTHIQLQAQFPQITIDSSSNDEQVQKPLHPPAKKRIRFNDNGWPVWMKDWKKKRIQVLLEMNEEMQVGIIVKLEAKYVYIRIIDEDDILHSAKKISIKQKNKIILIENFPDSQQFSCNNGKSSINEQKNENSDSTEINSDFIEDIDNEDSEDSDIEIIDNVSANNVYSQTLFGNNSKEEEDIDGNEQSFVPSLHSILNKKMPKELINKELVNNPQKYVEKMNAKAKKRRVNRYSNSHRFWSLMEENALIEGYDAYKIHHQGKRGNRKGVWAYILTDTEYGHILKHRTNVQLKDKWRSLKNNGDERVARFEK